MGVLQIILFAFITIIRLGAIKWDLASGITIHVQSLRRNPIMRFEILVWVFLIMLFCFMGWGMLNLIEGWSEVDEVG